jgi:hypothetical protein
MKWSYISQLSDADRQILMVLLLFEIWNSQSPK